jgi:RHS repeat-associated protein
MGGSRSTTSAAARRSRLALSAILSLAIIVPTVQLASPIKAYASSYSSTILADSPKVYYRLDETGCCTAADSSGNGYSATYASSGITYSATGGITGDSDTAITTSYNGAAVTRSDSILPSGSSARTIELWEKTTSSGVYGLVSWGTASTNAYISVNIGSGPTLSFDGYANYVMRTPPYSLEDGAWHYLAISFDGTNAYLYVDGQLIGSGAVPLATVASQGLWLGNSQDGASVFPGSLDEVAIYPTALSGTQISSHWRMGAAGLACPATPSSGYAGAVAADHPTRYYRLGESSGRSAMDYASSTSCRPGAYTSGTSHASPGALLGDSDGAAVAPSPAALTIVGAPDSLPTGSAARTFELWEKTTTSGVFGLLSYGTTGTNQYISVNVGSSPTFSLDGYGNYVQLTPPYSLEDGNWHYLAVSFDGTNAYLYVDGQQIGSGAVPLSTVTNQSLWLGNSQDGAAAFPGSLDEVAIYSAALTASQINTHWRAGVAAAGCPSVPTTGYAGTVVADSPTRYYRLGETSGRAATDFASSTNCRDAAYTYGTTLSAAGPVIGDANAAAVGPSSAMGGVGSIDGLPSSGSPRTFEVWERATATGTMGLLSYGTASTNQYIALDITNTTLSLDAYTNYVMISTSSSLEDGKWHQVAATFDGTSTVTLYVDGAAIGTGTLSPSTTLQQGLWLGSALDGASYFQGALAEVAVYPTALSAARIQAHYSASQLVGGPKTAAQSASGGRNCACQNPTSGRGNATGSPIDTATGNFWHVFTDFSIPGRGYPLSFVRSYNSQSAASNSPLGYGWQFDSAMSLSQNGTIVTITQENGSQASFTQSGSTWTPSAPRFIATLTHNGDGTWTFVRQARDTYTFNGSGQLVSEKDLNGYTTSLSYTSGNLTTVTDPAGRTLSVGWTGSHITSVTDANVSPSRSVQFQYNDGAGNLTDVIDVGSGHWQFTYDSNHRMTVMKDPKCYATSGCPGVQNSYDSNGRVQWQKDQLNRQTSFTYGATQTTVTDPKGNQTVDAYNQGLRVATTKGYGTAQAATWHYAYDPSTLALIAVTDPNGNKTTYTVDTNGNPLTVTDPLGRQTTNTYNALNELLTTKDPNGVTTTDVYDSNGNLTSVSRPLSGTSQVQTTTYNHADSTHPGDVTSMVDPDNKTWAYGYDTNGDRNSVQDPLGNKATFVFNNDGWMTSSVTPKGNVAGCGCASQYTTTYAYNAFGQATTSTDPLGHTTVRHYDADQNIDTFTDGDGNVTTYVYDVANQQTQIKRADSPQTTLTTDYNGDGTVLDQKDGKNNAILTYGYDGLARVTSRTDALGNVTSFTYDGAGNQLTKQDPGGNCGANPKSGCTTFTYDAANQLKTITYSDGVTPNVSSITYDSDGQRTGMTDGTGTSAWVWDSLHRLTSYTNGNGAQVQYAYNLRSLPTTVTYPGSLNLTRGYDDAGRWTSVRDWLSNTTTFGYDPNSNLTTETLPSGSGLVDTFTYDAADRLMAISDVKGGTTTLFSATYTRDNANQLTSDSSAPSATRSYKYSPLNQVCYAGSSNGNACGSPPTGGTPYTYDAADNLTQTGATQQSFNGADELCWTATSSGSCASPPSGATTYTFDTRGNRTQIMPPGGGATTLSYDQANRLTTYGSSATYAYNGDGLRMSKTVSGTTSQFLWDAGNRLPLLIKDGSTAYVYGPTGLPLEQINGSTPLWMHHDQLGSTRLLTDANGTSQASYTFDAYGNLTASTGTATNPLRFAGQYSDNESGLYYLQARYYDPGTGQFTSGDPLESATRQPYSYAGSNPLNMADPSGLGTNPLKGILDVLEIVPYGVYYVSYRTESTIEEVEAKSPFITPIVSALDPAVPYMQLTLLNTEYRGISGDAQLDELEQIPPNAANARDEHKPIHTFPFGLGPITYGPGIAPNGQVELTPCHRYPWGGSPN